MAARSYAQAIQGVVRDPHALDCPGLRRSADLVRGLSQILCQMPGQQVINPVDRMIRNARQHMAQICFRIDVIELGGDNQAVDSGSALAT